MARITFVEPSTLPQGLTTTILVSTTMIDNSGPNNLPKLLKLDSVIVRPLNSNERLKNNVVPHFIVVAI